jgi:hypothetical protein
MHPDLPAMYQVRDPLATLPYRMILSRPEQSLTSDQHRALIHGTFHPDCPLVYTAGRGGKATDVLWAYDVSTFFFSAGLTRLLHGYNITGWSTYCVELRDKSDELLPGYQGIAVIGYECTRDRSRSRIVEKPAPVSGGRSYQVYRSLYFDEQEWDGSDFFWVSDRGGIVVTEKVCQIFRKYKIRNFEFTPLSEVEIRVGDDKYFSS